MSHGLPIKQPINPENSEKHVFSKRLTLPFSSFLLLNKYLYIPNLPVPYVAYLINAESSPLYTPLIPSFFNIPMAILKGDLDIDLSPVSPTN